LKASRHVSRKATAPRRARCDPELLNRGGRVPAQPPVMDKQARPRRHFGRRRDACANRFDSI
jgi:hypothetical protein